MDLHAIHNWIDESCGTIHTFQGKEANEVLLVLGCDRQQGMGAARWVGQKPNIINVAVSRAKYRVGVIGDYDLWNAIPYVQVVCKMLSHAVVTNNINRKSAFGIAGKYANPSLISEEEGAFERAMVEEYDVD